MNIFIDTNIYLAFFHYTQDDLSQLKKLADLLPTHDVSLYLPEQAEQEFYRNRATKLAESLRQLTGQTWKGQFPQICREYQEYPQIRQMLGLLDKAHSTLIQKIRDDVEQSNLEADHTIAKLFEKASRVESTAEILNAARIRHDCGNPPGKRSSLGDAINWEALLHSVPDTEELFIVSDDSDYRSPVNEERVHPFLEREWRNRKQADLRLYRRLSALFADRLPDIKLRADSEKENLIVKLANSGNFATTHNLIAKLAWYTDFSKTQANDLVEAAIGNSQVSWILTDDDVRDFYSALFTKYSSELDDDNRAWLQEQLNPRANDVASAVDEDAPF